MNNRILIIGCSGYIGSYLVEAMILDGNEVSGCDLVEPLNKQLLVNFYHYNYEKLEINELCRYDLILWFAGHSSVKKACQEPVASIQNNLIGLFNLINKVSKCDIPIIYASSASVLSGDDNGFSMTAVETTSNVYDAGKLALDIVAPYCGARAIGLRLSTMSGWSPKLRKDLVFNAMNISACKEGVVRVQNSSSFRSILFIDDLANYISSTKNIIQDKKQNLSFKPVGLSSWSGSIGQLAAEIAAYWNVPVEYGADSGTYSFVVNDQYLKNNLKNTNIFYKTIAFRCDQFRNHGGTI